MTDAITISGVNKQGGPASPLKSVFTTSLGSYFLQDLLSNDEDALVVSSSSMYAYGWRTQWSKSRAYVLAGPKDHPNHAVFHSVSIAPDTDPLAITEHRVELVANELDFLRTKVNDPTSRFDELKAFIECFRFPTSVGRLPITLLRKIVSQNIVLRCRALLSLQPIKQADAEALDKLIIRKVHDALGFPFQPSSVIATLPVAHHGSGFPSIARINAGLAVEGLIRDLNHHIPAYRTMAKITLVDWMCEKGDCSYPLDGDGLLRDFSRLDQSVPSAWLTAHRQLKRLNLSLREMDQSYIAQGDVSLSHLVRSCGHRCPQIPANVNGTTLWSLRLKGIRKLADVGEWMTNNCGHIVVHLSEPPFDKSWSHAARQNWKKLSLAIHDQLRIDDVLPGPPDLAVPRQTHMERAERLISSLANICGFAPSQYANASTWASDSSMIPSSAGVLDPKTVVGAATGSRTLAMKFPGSNISILHGELVGLILALVLSDDTGTASRCIRCLLTDHLNTVRLVEDSQSGVDQTPRLRFMNGRSYYRWLLNLIDRSEARIEYTLGHSTQATLEANMNNEADFYASTSQKLLRDLPCMPTPTFFMNSFTVHSASDGWIESNIPLYIDALMARSCAKELGIAPTLRMSTWAHDKHPPPDYPYTRAFSAHSAAVQLYARSGQLATADLLFTRGKLPDQGCRLGCGEDESMRHIFVKCACYQQWRDEACEQVVDKTTLK